MKDENICTRARHVEKRERERESKQRIKQGTVVSSDCERHTKGQPPSIPWSQATITLTGEALGTFVQRNRELFPKRLIRRVGAQVCIEEGEEVSLSVVEGGRNERARLTELVVAGV